jgi:hypothetical protein
MSTIQRLDWRQTENPPIRHLANVALVLDVALLDIVEDEWTEWTVLDESAAEAPPRGHWLPDRE